MAATNDPEVQRFRRVALQRFGEAQFLIEGGYNTGAIYLAGYAVECALKALLLAAVPARSRKKVLASFRGNNGHSFEWIKLRYIKAGGANFPPEIVVAITFVNVWSTELRYEPSNKTLREARRFLDESSLILEWSKRR